MLPQHDYGSVSGEGGSEEGTWEGRAGGGRGGVTGSRSPLASVSHREPKEREGVLEATVRRKDSCKVLSSEVPPPLPSKMHASLFVNSVELNISNLLSKLLISINVS